MTSLLIICFFTFLIHITESVAYSMRLAGVRSGQIAIAMSFVSSTLLVSRLSNMFQAPLLGAMVDGAILQATPQALDHLLWSFRLVVFAGFLGSFGGAFLTPSAVGVFQKAIQQFLKSGSVARLGISLFRPTMVFKLFRHFRFPSLKSLGNISLEGLPKSFLILNMFVASIYTIGVLCSLLAGAYLPEYRSTAIQLSGIVNGIATIMFTLFVDPAGARITDQAYHNQRPDSHVKSVVFFLQMGRLVGTLIIAQLLLLPFTTYILVVTKWLAKVFM